MSLKERKRRLWLQTSLPVNEHRQRYRAFRRSESQDAWLRSCFKICDVQSFPFAFSFRSAVMARRATNRHAVLWKGLWNLFGFSLYRLTMFTKPLATVLSYVLFASGPRSFTSDPGLLHLPKKLFDSGLLLRFARLHESGVHGCGLVVLQHQALSFWAHNGYSSFPLGVKSDELKGRRRTDASLIALCREESAGTFLRGQPVTGLHASRSITGSPS